MFKMTKKFDFFSTEQDEHCILMDNFNEHKKPGPFKEIRVHILYTLTYPCLYGL